MIKQQKIKKHFNQTEKLTLKNKQYLEQVEKFTVDSLKTDLNKAGDITTKTLIGVNKKIKAEIFVKEKGIIAGLEEAAWFLEKNKIKVKKIVKDGNKVKNNKILLKLNGGVKDILKIERTVLNLLQRMSGIATQTNMLVKKVKNKALVCSTRKTQWGLLDKKAVVIGGGGTHRLGLHDFILIKDNHLRFLDKKIDKRVENFSKKKLFWEIEVNNKKQALWAAAMSPDAIMFDNFKPKEIKKIIKQIRNHYPEMIFEASGSINKENIKKYRKAKVDVISVGSLTHSSPALDISLDIV